MWLRVQNEYLGLVEQCMNFAYELMDLCRGTQEVEAVLSECRDPNDTGDPLARLKMALEYEEKKVNCIVRHDAVAGGPRLKRRRAKEERFDYRAAKRNTRARTCSV